MTAIVFTWTIDNFLDKTDKPILSPHFTFTDHPQIEWLLKLCPRGDCQLYPDSSDYVSLFLIKMTDEFEAEVELDLVMVGNESQVESMTLKNVFSSQKDASWGWVKFVKKSRLINGLLVDGNLKIQVKNARVVRVFEVKDCLNATVFDWDIDNFLSLREAKLTSDKFTIPGHPLIKWQLICYPKKKDSIYNGNSVIYVEKCTDYCEIDFEFKMTVVGKKQKARIYKGDFKNTNDFSLAVHQDFLNNDNYLINGMLKIRFKVFRVVKVVYQDHHLNYFLNNEPLNFDDIKKHSDFRLKTLNKTFNVQKYVLAKKSPYFKTMLDGNFKEKKKNEVDLSQFKSEVIQEVLRFVYTGQLHSFDELSDQLIIAADYFQMDYLKILCQENMSFRLSLDNCLKFLQIGDQNNATQLKEAAMHFLNKNKSRLNKQKLTKFFRENAELGAEWTLWTSS